MDNKKGFKLLKGLGAENIKSYVLINNYGYTFDLDGERHDVRFMANMYGCYIGKWSSKNKSVEQVFNVNIGEDENW